MQRHVSDPYVKRARALGYRSRAAFKLLEIDAKDRVFARGARVVDLGAAPGGWSQVAAEKVGPRGRVVAVDLLPMAPIEGVTFIRGDLTDPTVRRDVEDALGGAKVDLVLSDMAPNLSGVAAVDQAQSSGLSALAIEFALGHLAPGGGLLLKAFHGTEFPALLARLRACFERVVVHKPGASRRGSAETYLLGRAPRVTP